MKCPKCGGPARIQVQATLATPAELAHQFSKSNLRRKDCYLLGVNWETMDIICTSPKCRHVSNGYGNYVTRLADRVRMLEDILKEYGRSV